MRTKNQKLVNKKYGKRLKEDLLEQYKLMVDTSDKISSRRQKTNNFYLTLNSVLFGVAGYLTAIDSHLVSVLFSIIGLSISYIWRKNIESYKKLNSAKFKVIHELEGYLPAALFTKEDEYLKKGGYYELTSVEKYIPFIFGVMYLVIIVMVLVFFGNII